VGGWHGGGGEEVWRGTVGLLGGVGGKGWRWGGGGGRSVAVWGARRSEAVGDGGGGGGAVCGK